jgi:haloacid dehalogenase-like hydrolase
MPKGLLGGTRGNHGDPKQPSDTTVGKTGNEHQHQKGLYPAVGDAENDLATFRISQCSIAVANALESVKQKSDIVLHKARGEGVMELIDKIVANDLAEFDQKLRRHCVSLGHQDKLRHT